MTDDPKLMARRLRAALGDDGVTMSHSRALEVVAQMCGWADWNTMSARAKVDVVDGGPVRVVGRVTTPETASTVAWLEAIGFGVEGANVPGLGVRLRSGDTEVVVEHQPIGMTSTHLVFEVADVEVAQRRVAALPHDAVHAGPLVMDAGQMRFDVSTSSGHELVRVRGERRARPEREQPGVISAQALISNTWRHGWTHPTVGGPASFAIGELFRRMTGQRLSAVREDPGRPLSATGRSVRFGRGESTGWVPFVEIAWESDGSRGFDGHVLHRDGSPASRIRVDTTSIAEGDLVMIVHDGWTAHNAFARSEYLDWQPALDNYVSGCVPQA